MLSPTVSVQPPEGPASPEQTTRRRGLSYLRSLSSHSSTTNPEPSRSSPRSLFQRSSSYNNESKAKQTTGRRRSVSRPNEPTRQTAQRPPLSRVLSAGNSPIPSSVLDGNSSGEDSRSLRAQASLEETTEVTTTITPTTSVDNMARTSRPSTPRRATDSVVPAGAESSREQTNGTRPVSVSVSNGAPLNTLPSTTTRSGSEEDKPKPPMIRLFPHQDVRNNGRQSLNFSPVSRILPNEKSIIRVGRYSEREGLPVANPKDPSDAPVGFKSKVVSRKHCEFSFVDGQWQIRDVASSSGTFLNHIRLSQPNQESRLFPVKDGDIVQLGIDFRGGEEMIFRCVKIRIECNRSWQKKPNNFNKTRQAHLLGLTKDQPAAGQNSGECSICLGSVLPCQSLFVAPCAHVWHYKCIRPMIEGRQSQYPSFQCPNCRAWTDLEADVDVAEEEMDAWMENGGDTDDPLELDQTDRPRTADGSSAPDHTLATMDTVSATPEERSSEIQTDGQTVPAQQPSSTATTAPQPAAGHNGLLSRRAVAFAGSTEGTNVGNIAMPVRPNQEEITDSLAQESTPNDSSNGDHIISGEGPLTPRNNAGPFVFDGSGGAGDPRRRTLFVPGLFEVAENRST